MIVKSTKSITFPKLNWSIAAGEEKELPEDKGAQAQILSWAEITKVESKGDKINSTKSDEDKK